jgi:hypothetical protein
LRFRHFRHAFIDTLMPPFSMLRQIMRQRQRHTHARHCHDAMRAIAADVAYAATWPATPLFHAISSCQITPLIFSP